MKLYDYYKLFNLPIGASQEKVVKAHDDMVNEWFQKPAKKSSMDELERVLNQAMFVLTNPLRKEAYDKILLKYYIQKSQKENYRKYGVSCNNPWKSIGPRQQSDAFEKETQQTTKIPKLKHKIWMSSLFLFLTLCVYSFTFFKAYSGLVMITFVVLFGIYIVLALYGLRNVFNYFQVREKVKPKVTAARAVAYSSALVYLAVPFLLIQGLRALPNAILSKNSPKAKVVKVEAEKMWATAVFMVNGEAKKVSLLYPNNKNKHDLYRELSKGKLCIQHHGTFSAISRWKFLD